MQQSSTSQIATAQGTLPTKRLIPVPKWNKYHEWPPQGGLRHLIFHAKTNGFDRVVKRAGRRVLIDELAFFEWVESQGGN